MNIVKNLSQKLELCYVWISSEDSGLIQNQGFTFTNKYVFDCKCDKSQNENLQITIKKNDKYIENFFCNNEDGNKETNIENISLVVGKNGSGKSTLLNYLYNKLFDVYDTDNIAIFKSNNVFIVLYFLNKPMIKTSDESPIKYYTYSDIYGEKKGKEVFKDNYGGIKVITYSDNFRNNSIYGSSLKGMYPTIKNISTSGLLKELYSDEKYNNKNLTQAVKLEQHDMLIMLEFIKIYMKNKDELIQPPIKYLIIKSENLYENRVYVNNKFITNIPIFNDNHIVETNIENQEYKIILKTFKKLRENWFNIMLQDKKTSCFEKNMLMNIAYDIFNSFRSGISDKNIFDFYSVLNEYLRLKKTNLADDIIDMLSFLNDKGIRLEKDQMYTNFIKKIINMKQQEILRYDDDKAIIKLNNNSINEINEFIRLYWNTLSKPYCTFLWGADTKSQKSKVRYLSSGENAMLLMYSRFYSIISEEFRKVEAKQDIKDKSLLILMDEPELYLHPEWQRNLIYRLITFFNKYFSEYNVQLIISSNTPFLITDIPKENLILLNKECDKNGEYHIIAENKEFTETFGQNIHTLLAQYFMDFSIGEFAKQKISKIIKVLNSEDSSLDINIRTLEKEINIIGEPIIKNKLIEMFDSKFNKKPENQLEIIDRKIKELQEERKRLEKERDNKNA